MKRTIFCVGVGLALFILPKVAIAQGEIPAAELHGELFARDTFRLDSVVCPFKGEIEYEPGEIECYLLQVPENREKPDSRFIELHVVKLNSTWDDEEAEKKKQRKTTRPVMRWRPAGGMIRSSTSPAGPARW